MDSISYENKCNCKEEFSITKKPKFSSRSEGKPLKYLKSKEIMSRTFQIKYEKKLSLTAKLILNSFRNKFIHYAIDDVLYLLKSDPVEQSDLLSILHSQVLSLQNNYNLPVNSFNIWIHEIYVNEVTKVNKFINNDFKSYEQFSYITIKLLYKPEIPIEEPETLW